MAKGYSGKIALNNIRNYRKFYLPYILAGIGIIMMFYIVCFLGFNRGLSQMKGFEALSSIMRLGIIVVGIFSFIFLFYTNSFLMKKRSKEIGLYNVLGMEKKHISKILAVENVVIAGVSIVIGLIAGVIFSKLVHMILAKIIHLEGPIVFQISITGIVITTAFFAAVYIIILLYNQMKIRLSNPISLIKGSDMGEREPKIKWAIAVMSVLCLGLGYFIAIVTESPIKAVFLFFIAVVLVIIGTYCLFTAGSIALLKFLKSKKSFYYKPSNFIAVSGMIYRMKQNAVGLANICILSTMVLVMVSSTVCLYTGMVSVMDKLHPGDINMVTSCEDGDVIKKVNPVQIKKDVEAKCQEHGVQIAKWYYEEFFGITASDENGDNKYQLLDPYDQDKVWNKGCEIYFVKESEYERITGKSISLKGSESISTGSLFNEGSNPSVMGRKLKVIGINKDFAKFPQRSSAPRAESVVVSNEFYQEVFKNYRANVPEGQYDSQKMATTFVLSGDDETKIKVWESMNEVLSDAELNGVGVYSTLSNKQTDQRMLYELVGGFLFLGIFMSIIFTFAAAMIIYYKQISEGYSDKKRFEIMQKVGMSKQEVRRTIGKQVLMVFFAPLLLAGIHVIAAFKMITRLLVLFGFVDDTLFMICTGVSISVFALIYAIVYGVTAKEYYKIVG